MPNEQLPSMAPSQHHHMRKLQILCVFVNLFQFHAPSRIVRYVVEDHHQFSHEIITFGGRLQLSCDQNLYRGVVLQYFIELVEHFLVILLCVLVASLLLVLDCDWDLSLFGRELLSFLPLLHFDLVFDGIALIMDLLSFLFIFDCALQCFERFSELLHSLWTDFAILFLPSQLFMCRFLDSLRLRLIYFCHC